MSSTGDTGQNLPEKEPDVSGDGDTCTDSNKKCDSPSTDTSNAENNTTPSVPVAEEISTKTKEVQSEMDEVQTESKDDETKQSSTDPPQSQNVDNQEKEQKEEKEEEFLDILGNGCLLKKVIEPGSGKRPMMGDQVNINVIREIPDTGKVFPAVDMTYTLGDGDVEQSLDLAVALMNIGETAIVVSGFKYMHGELGLEPDIPPFANFKMTVHLKSTDGFMDYSKLDFDTRFNHAQKKKDRGNFMFKRKEYTLALNSYTKASKIVDPNSGCVFTEESADKLQKLLEFRATVLCNTSATQFKLEAYEAAAKSALEASKIRPSYSKAFCRLGQAQEKLGKIDDTIRSYKTALKNEAENSKWIHGELERLTKLNKKNKQSQKEMYSKMFWGSKPPVIDKPAVRKGEDSMFSWLWKMGATVLGAGVVGIAGIGIYRYMNH